MPRYSNGEIIKASAEVATMWLILDELSDVRTLEDLEEYKALLRKRAVERTKNVN